MSGLKELSVISKCLERIDSKYRLIIVAAKRTRQLIAKKKETVKDFNELSLVETSFKKPTTIALEEFAKGAIDYEIM